MIDWTHFGEFNATLPCVQKTDAWYIIISVDVWKNITQGLSTYCNQGCKSWLAGDFSWFLQRHFAKIWNSWLMTPWCRDWSFRLRRMGRGCQARVGCWQGGLALNQIIQYQIEMLQNHSDPNTWCILLQVSSLRYLAKDETGRTQLFTELGCLHWEPPVALPALDPSQKLRPALGQLGCQEGLVQRRSDFDDLVHLSLEMSGV